VARLCKHLRIYAAQRQLPLDLGMRLADTLEAAIGAYFLHEYVDMKPHAQQLRDSLGMLIACIAPHVSGACLLRNFVDGPRTPPSESALQPYGSGTRLSALSFGHFLLGGSTEPDLTKTKIELLEDCYFS